MARKEGDGPSEDVNHSRVLAATRGLAAKLIPFLSLSLDTYKLLRFVRSIEPCYLAMLDAPHNALRAARVGSCTMLTAIDDFHCVWEVLTHMPIACAR